MLAVAFPSASSALSPCSPAKRQRLITNREAGEADSQQAQPGFSSVSNMERQSVSDEEEVDSEGENMPIKANLSGPSNFECLTLLNQLKAQSTPCQIVNQPTEAAESKSNEKESNGSEDGDSDFDMLARARWLVPFEGESVEIPSNSPVDKMLKELFNVLSERGFLEKKSDRVFQRVIPKEAAATQNQVASTEAVVSAPAVAPTPMGPKFDSKAYYQHPHPEVNCLSGHSRSSINLAAKAALGTLGETKETSFSLPEPLEMLHYQMKCLDNFMKRYHEFYRLMHVAQDR